MEPLASYPYVLFWAPGTPLVFLYPVMLTTPWPDTCLALCGGQKEKERITELLYLQNVSRELLVDLA